MRSQGIRGPSYKFPYGNLKEISDMKSQSMDKPMDISHDIFPRHQPHVYAWTKAYGRNFICWYGSQCQLTVTEPELVKEILMNREGVFPKIELDGSIKILLGGGLITNDGEKWARVRKVANRTFHAESLKNMVLEMSLSVEMMLKKWESHGGKEIDVFKEFGLLTADVISRTALGISYMDGKVIIDKMAKLTLVARNAYKARVPGIRFLVRSDDEVEMEKLKKGIKSSISEQVRKRERDGKDGSDYLGQLVKKRITIEQMIDEIKTIYSAGHGTVASLLGWSVLLLAIHTEWQERARKEVNETFGDKSPDSDGIARLKTMNMIINECMRLYPPALSVIRRVAKETKIGELRLSPKTNVFIPILALHHDPRIWGEDVHLFRPERFAGGVAKATSNKAAAFMPFGMGPRTCVGLDFTINEVKIALSMILHKYKVILSPNYVHYPVDVFILTPKYGIQVILEKIYEEKCV